jgi:hypothetical protein
MASRVLRLLCVCLIVTLICGCAAVTTPEQSAAAKNQPTGTGSGTLSTAPDESAEHRGITGVWEGVSVADCTGVLIADMGRCAARQNITLTMFQEGGEVKGYYRCAYGTQNCRGLAETGVIKNGSMEGRRLMMRVMLDDGSMCYFTGIPAGDRLDGRYSCMTTGLFEQGRFRTQRSY